jgi:hypothetical protein
MAVWCVACVWWKWVLRQTRVCVASSAVVYGEKRTEATTNTATRTLCVNSTTVLRSSCCLASPAAAFTDGGEIVPKGTTNARITNGHFRPTISDRECLNRDEVK